jgi:hypothetical protein
VTGTRSSFRLGLWSRELRLCDAEPVCAFKY